MRRHITLALAALMVAASLSAYAVELKIGGYVQARFDQISGGLDAAGITKYSNDNAATSTFGLRRARLNATATLSPRAQGSLEIDASQGTVSTKTAYVVYALPELNITMGRIRNPFTYELGMSSSALTTLERSEISQRAAPEYAVGLFLTPGSNIVPFKTTLAIMNDGQNSTSLDDQTNRKIVMLTAESPEFVGVHVGGSYATDSRYVHAYDLYARGMEAKISFLAEYVHTSRLDDKQTDPTTLTGVNKGYYALASYALDTTDAVYARYDHATIASAAAPLIPSALKRTTIGASRMLDDGAKWSVEYQFIKDPTANHISNAVATQLQMKF